MLHSDFPRVAKTGPTEPKSRIRYAPEGATVLVPGKMPGSEKSQAIVPSPTVSVPMHEPKLKPQVDALYLW